MQTPPPAARLARRSIDRFISQPSSIRAATLVLINVTVLIVLAGSVIVWIFDHEEFPDFGTAIWYTLQTVTTVGYGDVAPKDVIGRVVAALVMLYGIAFIAIITAVITSTFVARASHEYDVAHREEEESDRELIEKRFDELDRKLDALAAREPGA
jgi:voltage-gated potassium channel